MFRRHREDKAKLEHKLYLAREDPEPIFDLSECNLNSVPRGIYSLCRVFLKESLLLQNNSLHSLSGGGTLKDLQFIKILDISNNKFREFPDEILFLAVLEELYAGNNQFRYLAENVCKLEKLRILDISSNNLKSLPDNIGNLKQLETLKLKGNKNLHMLPRGICQAQSLVLLELDCDNFKYPPAAILERGAEQIIKYICDDTGYAYNPPGVPKEPQSSSNIKVDDNIQAKIRTLEKIKADRVKAFLEIERNNELQQKQEFVLANISKANRERLLADIVSQQEKLNVELTKVQQERDVERFRLIEKLQEVEHKADVAINNLLSVTNEPITRLLEQEKREEEEMIAIAMDKYNEALSKNSVLMDMQELLNQETEKFRQRHTNRSEFVQNMLEQEVIKDNRLLEVLCDNISQKEEFIAQLQSDQELQKAAVGTLLERGDARSWGLLQQVRLVEAQLAALTAIEINRRKLELDQHLNDLAEKRSRLSVLLMDLIHQQNQRRSQLLSTLQALDENKEAAVEDFWLRQYQGLLNRLPVGLSEAQKNLDPGLCQDLLMAGVISCLPFLAKLAQCRCDLTKITENELLESGVENSADRQRILKVFQRYHLEEELHIEPSAPCLEEASAPPDDALHGGSTSECVICMDNICHIIFVPCGHLCCCISCSSVIVDCPLCRTVIDRKIRIVAC